MSPYISGGVQVLDTDGFYTFEKGENRLRNRLTYDNGVTDSLMLRLRGTAQDNVADRYHYDSVEFGAKYAFAPPGELPLDIGIYGGVIVDEEDRDQTLVNIRLLGGKRFGAWQHHGEFLFFTSLQEKSSDTDLRFRFRTQYNLNNNIMFGGEYFSGLGTVSDGGSFEDTEQRLGPFIRFTPDDRAYFAEFTALPALNQRTEDLMIKWRVGIRF